MTGIEPSRASRRAILRWCVASGVAVAVDARSLTGATPSAAPRDSAARGSSARGTSARGSSARWPDERTAAPFAFHADFSLDDIGSFVKDIAELQTTLVRDLEIDSASEPIHIFLFQRKSTYQSYLKHFFPTVTARRAMYIKQRGPGMVFAYRHTDLAIDVRHESTHALLHAVLPKVPLWLDEGLAEYYEPEPESRQAHEPYLSTLCKQIRTGASFDLESLERLADLNAMGSDEYRRSWAWVHFMLHGPVPARDALRAFVGDLMTKAPLVPLSQRLSHCVPNWPQAFSDHFLALE